LLNLIGKEKDSGRGREKGESEGKGREGPPPPKKCADLPDRGQVAASLLGGQTTLITRLCTYQRCHGTFFHTDVRNKSNSSNVSSQKNLQTD